MPSNAKTVATIKISGIHMYVASKSMDAWTMLLETLAQKMQSVKFRYAVLATAPVALRLTPTQLVKTP